ncbi:putative nuclease HARBI1 [Bradysia coprophila]|uniref:putative nuclease HARBI1 n=1 Tax=Bradysia coprophila TaxID=38358 RepID=UPI00187DA36E|nr:putative nuclease HARBI1 [Bradysia coprophila]
MPDGERIACVQKFPWTVQFCSVLNFYASGSYQRRVASDAFAMMSQTMVSKCIRGYSYIITTAIMDDYVKFPQNVDEVKYLHDQLQNHVDFPGAFAFVDGSLITLAAVSHLIEHSYVSRKSSHPHAINSQFVCDIKMRFLSVNARYPGSTHDALIWRFVNTTLKRWCNQTEQNWQYFMLGDNGYPLQQWLLKPYDSPNTAAEEQYNSRHRKLRSLVERAIVYLRGQTRLQRALC